MSRIPVSATINGDPVDFLASPADSLDWPDYLDEINRSSPAVDDLGDG